MIVLFLLQTQSHVNQKLYYCFLCGFTFGACKITPNALKISYNIFSSISGSRLPINTLAPMSKLLVLEAAYNNNESSFNWKQLTLLTLIGFPYNLIIFIIFMA